jgi:UDP-N-acetylglucosamine 2-epimerase (non-hydrolysing)
LASEGVEVNNIFNVGNTGIDAILTAKKRISKNFTNKILAENSIELDKKFVLITGHRRENLGNGFLNICKSIQTIAMKYPELNFIYPVHLNPKVNNIVNKKLSGIKNIKLIRPLDYIPFISLMKDCHIIMTDSGGIQEEAPSFHKPVVVMRNTTERPEGVTLGMAKLCGTEPKIIEEAFDYFHTKSKISFLKNPYGDGKSSERIISTLIYANRRNNEKFSSNINFTK